MSADEFDPLRIIEILNRHKVDYVVIGGYAAQFYGATRPTQDIDVAPARTPRNLQRLSKALGELQARIRADAVPRGLPFNCSAESLQGLNMLNLTTPFGDLDLTFAPAGFPEGYDALVSGAQVLTAGELTINVAGLADVIKSKQQAARRKDAEALPELLDLVRRRARHPQQGRGDGRKS